MNVKFIQSKKGGAMRKSLILSAITLALCATLASCAAPVPVVLDEVVVDQPVPLSDDVGDKVPVEEMIEPDPGFEDQENYLAMMIASCLIGDEAAGLESQEKRNLKIDSAYPDQVKISFNDLYLLSKIIMAEAGSDWLSMEWKMMVGEVLLNRVASPEFPDTLEECIYQKGQYHSAMVGTFQALLPNEACVQAAVRLLEGERILNDSSVVFQGNSVQGGGVCRSLYDPILGNTYFCYSKYPELYGK
jgi:hypothetical protein